MRFYSAPTQGGKMRRKVVLLTLAALVAALTAAAALSGSPSVTITAPKSNQKVSLRQNPHLTVTGTAVVRSITTSEGNATARAPCVGTGRRKTV